MNLLTQASAKSYHDHEEHLPTASNPNAVDPSGLAADFAPTESPFEDGRGESQKVDTYQSLEARMAVRGAHQMVFVGLGFLQIGANLANGIKDAAVSTVEQSVGPANNLLKSLGVDLFGRLYYDFSRGLVTQESGIEGTWSDTHAWNKFLTASTAMAFAPGVWARMPGRGGGGPKGTAQGLFGIADKPVPGLRSGALKDFYVAQVQSPEFAKRLSRYNWFAERLGVKTASVDEIAEALSKNTTFHKTNGFFSALYERLNHGAGAAFRIQGTTGRNLFARSTAWHEATHLGAALRGQSDKLFRGGLTHELLVQMTMSPELFGTVVGGAIIVVGGTVIVLQ